MGYTTERVRFGWKIADLAKEKMREGRTVYKNIFMNTFQTMVTVV